MYLLTAFVHPGYRLQALQNSAKAGVYLLTAFVHLPYSPHDHPGGIGREKMPSVENAVGRVQGSGPPHYSGIRFGIRFRGAIRSHSINPIRSSPAGGVRELHGSGRCTLPFRGGNIDLRAGVDRSKCFCRILQKQNTALPASLILPRLRRCV